MRSRQPFTALAATVCAGTLLAGCTSHSESKATPGRQQAAPHGYVEGAEETAEPQPRLVVADGDTGAVHVLDLITEEVFEVGVAEGVDGISGDGRFAYLTTTGKTMHVIDGGAWTVDHGDHSHYYRAGARNVGSVEGGRPDGVNSDVAVTAVSFDNGAVNLLDRAKLEKGEITEIAMADAGEHRGTVVPYREHLLVSAAGAVEVRTRSGRPVTRIGEPCPEPRGEAVTRRGVVFGCADGALLVIEDGGEFSGEKIGYPEKTSGDDRAREFSHRPGSTTLAAKAGDRGIWVLDVSARRWELVETGPTVAVNAVGDRAPVLSLTADGTLRAFDPRSGKETARTRLLARPLPESGDVISPTIQVDTSRAYINDPAAKAVYEIDYNDDLRRARTFKLDFTPAHMVETGR
ncbi:hypothetical protein ABT061_03120 [Streptosporangium sp. NPDC002544]|uniref:hypothetical protein n=1 Tax=Streptosporangium sp. NPDC002544 TaxID=3154538 RepID=UPI003323FEC7